MNPKKRKPRSKKLNGKMSYDLCEHCYSYNCDPMSMSDKFSKKIDKRKKEKVCVACGKNPCECKSYKFEERAGVHQKIIRPIIKKKRKVVKITKDFKIFENGKLITGRKDVKI